jgi:hypothetical protein
VGRPAFASPIERFGDVAADILLEGAHARRKAVVDLLVSWVIHIEDGLALLGSPANLAKAVAACTGRGAYVVSRFVQKWRTRNDSAVLPLPSESIGQRRLELDLRAFSYRLRDVADRVDNVGSRCYLCQPLLRASI